MANDNEISEAVFVLPSVALDPIGRDAKGIRQEYSELAILNGTRAFGSRWLKRGKTVNAYWHAGRSPYDVCHRLVFVDVKGKGRERRSSLCGLSESPWLRRKCVCWLSTLVDEQVAKARRVVQVARVKRAKRPISRFQSATPIRSYEVQCRPRRFDLC